MPDSNVSTVWSTKNKLNNFSGAIKLSKQCYDSLCRIILLRTGIIIQNHQITNLVNAVAKACRQFDYSDAEEYINVLEKSNGISPELEYLISLITVRESYFFRDRGQISFIKDTWIPEVVSHKRKSGERNLSIWSAGCSGGQEIYTIAMMLIEKIDSIHSWDISLLGTDINVESLKHAESGRYNEWTLRTTPEYIVKKYFCRDMNDFVLSPDIRNMVRFSYHNLNDDFAVIHNKNLVFDMILCRNVFLYLDSDIIKQIVKKFATLLSPDGILLLGASDFVDTHIHDMKLHQRQNIFYYRRCHGKEIKKKPKLNTSPVFIQKPLLPLNKSNKHSPRNISSHVISNPVLHMHKNVYREVLEMAGNGYWEKLHEFVDAYTVAHGENAFLVSMKAKAISTTGELEKAVKLLEYSTELDKTCKHSYYILATLMIELGNVEEAQRALRRAIYLDSYFLEAHFHLGLILLRLQDYKAGLKRLRNALKLAENANPENALFMDPDLTYGQLASILRNEIRTYESSMKNH